MISVLPSKSKDFPVFYASGELQSRFWDSVKSPFRYPGGKFYALKKLLPFVSCVEHDEYREPFIGGGSVFFYNYDGHGSVRNLTDNLGNVTDTYDYDAFGNLIARTGTTENNYLYAGEQFDANLGFYYNRARYLNVETGRFVSQDSYGSDG